MPLSLLVCCKCPNSFRRAKSSENAVAACILAFLAVVPTCEQTQQQYVYAGVPTSTTASEVASFSKDSATGALSALATSPTQDNLEGGVMTVDALGRFLFVLNRSSGKISMFTIDSISGALQEVGAFSAASNGPNSPQPAFPSCLAVESTGQFLYVGYDVSSDPGRGAIQSFQIDSTNLQLLPLPTQFATDLDSSPIGLISALKGRFLYAGLGLNLSTLAPDGETIVFQIDPVTGQLNANGFAGSARARGRSIAIDPQGRYFFEAWGTSASQAFIDAAPISPSDGTAASNVQTLLLPPGELPTALLAESSGKFLYAQQSSGVVAYSINQSTGALTQSQPATQALTLQNAHAAADPLGPYLYSLANDGIHAFQIDPQAGALSPLPGSPFSTGATGNLGLAISGTPSSTQAVSGPAASLFPSSQSFDSVTVGQPATTRVITLTNTGDQLVLITKISIGGLNAPDFTQTATCLVSLKPGDTCSISVTFTPTAPGLRQATLIVADNAPGGSQSVPLTGTGVAQQPEVTLAPAAFVFATPVNQGSTSQPQSVSLTNDGTASLHITSLSLDTTSANASDFALTFNTCSATLAVKATCVITATFSPLGNGPRSANILVVDDAPGSPQQIPLTGTGTGAPVTHPGISFAPASISFPATAQNASSPAQTLTITNSGTGILHFLAAPALGGPNPSDFSLTNNCSAAAYVPTDLHIQRHLHPASCRPSLRHASHHRRCPQLAAIDRHRRPGQRQSATHLRPRTHRQRHPHPIRQSWPDRHLQPDRHAEFHRQPHVRVRWRSNRGNVRASVFHQSHRRRLRLLLRHHCHSRSLIELPASCPSVSRKYDPANPNALPVPSSRFGPTPRRVNPARLNQSAAQITQPKPRIYQLATISASQNNSARRVVGDPDLN